ncbi:class E sortase [Kutzneria sp. CA-103260]|uniref:class E sortase n=1 Tax=Kutzneria sp. CA-103260 TaxID=2802641 RepID=UPI001BA8A910|nr:class E sortase [Kutzneria sp. CA-103260]QUQ63562.1 peptidase C60, sortase A and B [Kutzneria sp. CA-103260]
MTTTDPDTTTQLDTAPLVQAEPATEEIGAGAPPPAATRPPRPPMPFEAKLLSQILGMLAVGLLGLAGYLLVLSPIEQSNDQDRLYAQLREELAAATAPTGGVINAGSPVALLTIPGLSFNQVVVEGTAPGDLRKGPGHRRDTPLPGQAGVSLVYGRSATFGAPFAQIDRLQPGDRITASTGQGEFTYRVLGVRRVGDPLPPQLAKGSGRLTLETSAGADPLQHGETLFVDADLVSTAAPTPGGRPGVIPPEESAMASDANASIPLVLGLQALGVLLGLLVWARHRWGRREATLLGIPLIVAVVWNLYGSVAELLPNML